MLNQRENFYNYRPQLINYILGGKIRDSYAEKSVIMKKFTACKAWNGQSGGTSRLKLKK